MPTTNHWKEQVLLANIAHDTDTFRVALGNDSTAYSFDPDHEFVDDVFDGGTTASEFGGSGYSRQDLTGLAVTQDDGDDEGVWDASDVTFTSLDGETIQFVMVYKQVGGDDTTPADDPIVVIFDDANVADLPLTTNGGDVTISWSAEGIVNIT